MSDLSVEISDLEAKQALLQAKVRSAELERQNCLLNLASFMARRHPGQAQEAIRRLLTTKDVGADVRQQANSLALYLRDIQQKGAVN